MSLDDNRKCAGCGTMGKDWVRVQVAKANDWRKLKTWDSVVVCFDCTDKLISLIEIPTRIETPTSKEIQ